MPKIPSYDIVTAVNPTTNQQVNLNVGEGVIDKTAITHPLSMFNIANDAVQEQYQQTKKAEQLIRQSEITTGFMRDAGELINGLKTENIDIAKARYSDFYQTKHQEIIDSIQDPLEKAETSAQLNRMSFKYEQDMIDNAFALQRSKNLSSMEESLFEIEKQASLTGDPSKRRVYLDAARTAIESRVSAGDIDPLVGAKRIMGLSENVEVNSIMSVMNSNPSAALSMLSNNKATGAISADKIIQLRNMAENEVKQKQSAAMSVVKDAFKKVSSGYDLPPEEMALVDKAIAQSGSKEIQAIASNMFNAAKVVGDLKYQTPQQIEAFYNTQIAPSLKKDGATAYEIMVAESVQNLASNMNSQLKKNPLEWDAQLKGNLDPVSIAEIVQNPVKMKERLARSAAVASYYNSGFVAFTDAEASKLSDDFTKLKNPEKAAFLQSLSSAAEGYPLGEIAKQIAPKSPVLAGAIAVAADSPVVAAKIASGHNLDIPKPSMKDFQSDFFAKVNNAIADPDALKTTLDSVYSYYNSLAYESNVQSDVIDSDLLDKAVTDVVGPIVDFNDQSVLSYKRSNGKWATEETFSDLFSLATIDDIIKSHSDYPQDSTGNALSIEDIRDRARFVATSQAGVYTMKYNNNFFVSDSSGQPFRFKMKELDDAVLKGVELNSGLMSKMRKTDTDLRLKLRELDAD